MNIMYSMFRLRLSYSLSFVNVRKCLTFFPSKSYTVLYCTVFVNWKEHIISKLHTSTLSVCYCSKWKIYLYFLFRQKFDLLIFRKLPPPVPTFRRGWKGGGGRREAFPFTWIVALALPNSSPRVDCLPEPTEYWSVANQSGGKPGRIRNGGSLGTWPGPANSCCQGSPSTRACTWSLF